MGWILVLLFLTTLVLFKAFLQIIKNRLVHFTFVRDQRIFSVFQNSGESWITLHYSTRVKDLIIGSIYEHAADILIVSTFFLTIDV